MDKKNEKNLKLQANQLSNDDLESVAGGEKVERQLNGEYWVVDEAGKFIRKATKEESIKSMFSPDPDRKSWNQLQANQPSNEELEAWLDENDGNLI